MKVRGFTLAELLIALAILGVIATFTIPKVLQSQQSSQKKAQVKSVAAAMVNALGAYRYQVGEPTASTGLKDLTPYLNLVKIDTSGRQIDTRVGSAGPLWCSTAGSKCLVFHDGSVAWYQEARTFGGTALTNAVNFILDPDGEANAIGVADNPGKGIQIYLYHSGAIRTLQEITVNTCSDAGCGSPAANTNPSWFDWQ